MGAFICALTVVVLLFVDLYLYGRACLTSMRSSSLIFEAMQTIWWVNLAAAGVAALGNLLHVAEDEKRADILAFSGICGVFSFLVVGIFYIFAGFAAGKIFLPILMCFVTAYACLIVFLGTSYFVQRLRKIEPRYDKDYFEDIVE